MANTTAIATANTTSAIDMTVLLNLVAEGKAFIIVPSAEDMAKFANLRLVVDNTRSEEVKREMRRKNLHTRLHHTLDEFGITHESGKGAKKGVIRDNTYKFLYEQMDAKKGFKVKEVLSILKEAGYTEEGRGLKYDIVSTVYNMFPNYRQRSPLQVKAKERMIEKLETFPLTNDFAPKFADYLAK